jgi:hypothetical protein
MESDAARKARLAALCEEVGSIHSTTMSFWGQGFVQRRDLLAECQHSQDRLEEIRSELVQMRSPQESWLRLVSARNPPK